MIISRNALPQIPVVIIALIPFLNLYAWENFDLFNSALSHRIWIIWCEILIIALLITTTNFNISNDIKKNPKLLTPIFLFLACGFISCLFAQNSYASLVRHTEICLHFLLIYLLSHHIKSDKQRAIIIVGLIAAFLYTVFHFSLLRLAVGGIEYNWVKHIPFFSNIRHWGYLQVLVLPLSYFFITNPAPRAKLAGYSLFTIIWVSIIWSGGRGPLIASLIGCFAISPILFKLSKKQTLITVALFLLALFISLKFEANHSSLSISRLFFVPQVISESKLDLNATSSGRLGIYKDALSELIDVSPLFGMGADNYRYSLKQQHIIPTHPHSSIIQLTYEYGIIGLILTLYFILQLTQKGLTLNNNIQKASFICLICSLILSLVDGNYYHSVSIFNIIILISIITSDTSAFLPTKEKHTPPVLGVLLILTCVWLAHTYTYSKYTTPLKSIDQVNQTQLFPSIVLTPKWINPESSKPALEQALIHGIKWSDSQCAHKSLLKLYFNKSIKNNNIQCNTHYDTIK